MRRPADAWQAGLLALALLGVAQAAFAQLRSDLAREKRWADQVLPSLVVGEAVTLRAGDGTGFLALYAVPAQPRAAVLLAHGPGVHPDHGITGELRVALVDRGYATLSLQMPVLPAGDEAGEKYRTLYPEAIGRFAAGVRYLQERGHPRVAVVSHAMGSGMFYAYWQAARNAPVAAWVALSFYGAFDALEAARFPVFDLHGADDYRGIRGYARDRRRVLDALPGSRQLALEGGGPFLAGGEAAVLREVPAFLDTALR